MRKPNGKIKINNAGENVAPNTWKIPNGRPSNDEPFTQASERHGE